MTFSDDFNRSDRVLDGDNGWVAQGGTWNIVSNQAVLTSLSGGAVDAVNMFILRRNVGASSGTVSVLNVSNSLHGPSSLLIGYNPAVDDGYLMNFEPGGGATVYIRRINGGSPYQLNIGSPVTADPVAWAPGGSTTLAVSFNASTGTFTAYQNDVPFFTVTDPSPFTTGTWVGFASNNTSTGHGDEFFDDFNFSPVPSPVISADLIQNNLDISVVANVINSAPGPYTYTIDYNDGITDSFTTSSTTHTFTHTYLDTTPKTIKVQAYSLLPSAFNVASTGTAAHSTTVAVFVDNTVQVGDLLIFAAAGYASSGITADPTGWNRIDVTRGTADIPIDLGLWWRIATNADPGVISSAATFPNSDYHVGVILAYSGYGAVRSSALVGGSVAAGASITTPTLTAVSGDAVISVWAGEGDTGVAPGFTIDAADTFRADVSLSFPRLMLGDETSTGGVTTARTASVSGGGVVSWASAQVAISPSPTRVYSNIVLLYPVWVSGSATFGSNRIGFRSPSNRRTL